MTDKEKHIPEGVIFKIELPEEVLNKYTSEIVLKTVEAINKQSKSEPKPDSTFISGEAVCRILDISRTTLWQLDKKSITRPIWLRNIKRYKLSDIEALGENSPK